MRSTLAILILIASAMAFAGPAESHHDHLCTKHAPSQQACDRH